MLEDMANVEDFAHFLGMDGVFVMHLLEAQSNFMVASAGSPRCFNHFLHGKRGPSTVRH